MTGRSLPLSLVETTSGIWDGSLEWISWWGEICPFAGRPEIFEAHIKCPKTRNWRSSVLQLECHPYHCGSIGICLSVGKALANQVGRKNGSFSFRTDGTVALFVWVDGKSKAQSYFRQRLGAF